MKDSLLTKTETAHFSLKDSPVADSLSAKDCSGSDTIQSLKLEDIFSAVLVPAEERPSLFKGHSLKKKSAEAHPIQPPVSSNAWVFCVLIAVSIIFSWIFGVYRLRIKQMLRAYFSNRHMGILTRDGNILKEKILGAVACIHLPLIALFAYFLAFEQSSVAILTDIPDFSKYLIGLAAISFFIGLKFFVIRFLGNVFCNPEVSTTFLTTEVNFDLLTGIILLPLLFLLYFSHSHITLFLTVFTVAIIGILYIFKIIRSFSLILVRSRLSKLYLFYYLCATEIIPILIIIKLVIP